MKTKLYIDGDIIAYRVCTNHEKETPINSLISNDKLAKMIQEGIINNYLVDLAGENIDILWSNANECIGHLNNIVIYYQDKFNADEVIVAISDSENFRKDILDSYKAHRTKSRKPIALAACKNFLVKEWGALIEPKLEADDLIGILASKEEKGVKKITISADKDFESIPYQHWFNPDKMAVPKYIDLDTANYKFWEQTMTGDSADNYKGCPQFGPKKVENLLSIGMSDKVAWGLMLKEFEKKGLEEKDLLVQARCARLLRDGEYDFNKKEIKLWNIENL